MALTARPVQSQERYLWALQEQLGELGERQWESSSIRDAQGGADPSPCPQNEWLALR